MGQTEKDAGQPKKRKRNKTSRKKGSDQMLMFAAEYIIDWNGTRAYKAVYGVDDATAAQPPQDLQETARLSQK